LDLSVVLLGEDSTNWVAECQRVDLCRKDCCGFVLKLVLNRSKDSKTPSNGSIRRQCLKAVALVFDGASRSDSLPLSTAQI
ncbi:unnamed protein product, partial [Arabidopsis halleri]